MIYVKSIHLHDSILPDDRLRFSQGVELKYGLGNKTRKVVVSTQNSFELHSVWFVAQLHLNSKFLTSLLCFVQHAHQRVFITLWFHSPEERSPQMAQMCLVSDRAVPEGWAGTFITPLRPKGGLMSSVLLTEFIGEFSWNTNTQTHTATGHKTEP